ncbi:MAG TPA: hypothetical protein VKV95_09325 [Terriglobia bacterium]|nr:hypothetical protein [Terriglobia bacterium]
MKRNFLFGVVFCLIVVSAAGVLSAQDATPKENTSTTGQEYTIPEGTEFKLQLHTAISSKTSKAGDRVMTTLIDSVAVEDQEVLSKGLRIDGHIGEVKAAARRGKGGYITVVFDTLEMPNGEKVAILGSLTEIFSSEGGSDPTVGAEGDLKGHGASVKERAAIVLIPTAAGAAMGIGPGIAAAAGGIAAALIIPRGKQAALAPGSLIGMRLDQDVTVSLAPTPASDK